MGIRFERPWLLLLILPLILFVYYSAKGMTGIAGWRRKAAIFSRCIIFLLIVFLLSGIVFEHSSGIATTIFLVDSSDSIRDEDEATWFVREALKGMGRNDEAGVINFGGNAAIEVLPGKSVQFTDIQTRVDTSFTDLENALISARSVMPWENKKRIVLVTDGRENAGDVLKEAKRMREDGYTIDVFPLSSDIEAEVQLKELYVPESVNRNEIFEINLNVASNISCDAVIYLYTDRTLTGSKKVRLSEGDNRFAFSDRSDNGGMVTYTVEIVPDIDTFSQNNSLSTFTFVEDVPRILVVANEGQESGPLVEILREDMDLTVINPKQVPVELSELLKYDAFIFDNISADDLNEKFLQNLETAVSHQGKGLMAAGGDKSFGPGGYYKTVLEKILPVNMDIREKEEDPSLALMLVIDKSGSMADGEYGISKIEMAREAAIRSTEVLGEKDTIGVIAFDDAFKWVVKPQKPDNIKAIQDQIASIRAGGGTQILPPLKAAYDSILEIDAKLKHIILLTDGQAEKSGYETIIDGLRENGITLSTVAVGQSADFALLKALAYGGRGRYYETNEFSDIPKIFAKEVFLAGKEYLVNRSFIPVLRGYSEILKGINAVPGLDGYVATTAKSSANVIFESDEGDPILASWQYGLGRTIAWTPDIHGVWTNDWMGWENASVFWKNAVSWLVQQSLGRGYTVDAEIEGKKGTIIIRAEDNAFMTYDRATGTLIGPDGTKQEIELNPGAPGEYRGTVENLSNGVYIADITLYGSDGKSERISTGLIMPYSREYDLLTYDDGKMLQKIAFEGGGRLLTDPKQVFSGTLQNVYGMSDPAFEVVVLLTVLFILDVTVRRIKFEPGKWMVGARKVLGAGKTAAYRTIGAALRKQAEKITNQAEKREIKKIMRDTQSRNNDFDNGSTDIKKGTEKSSPDKKAGSSGESSGTDHISYLLEKKRKWKR